MSRSTAIIAGAALVVAGALHFSAAEAQALPVASGIHAIAATAPVAGVTEQVQYRPRVNRGWRGGWNRGWHGNRFRYRHGPYRHYYRGYWYNNPWWLGAAITAPLALGAYAYSYPPAYGYSDDTAHVQWCLNRYRSYDPASDSYMGYDGYRHRCNSPY